MLNEQKMHTEKSSFITLTYKDQHLPDNASLDYTHWQKFIRSLKKRNNGKSIRYYAVGEYGDNFGRPHFHAILFGHTFDDQIQLKGKRLNNLYKSQKLQNAWCTSDQQPRGYVSVGDVTPESISYVAGYVQKKVYGQRKDNHYKYIDTNTGEITPYKTDKYFRQPEKAFMSRKPGIGSTAYDAYHSDWYRLYDNNIHIKGKPVAVPRYYNNKFKKTNPAEWSYLQQQKEELARTYSPEDLKQHEANFTARMSIYKREKLK